MLVIGQRNDKEITPNKVVPDRLFVPFGGGVAIDKQRDRLYLWDGGNSRVLVFAVSSLLADAAPQPLRVIGQPDFASSAANGDSTWLGYPERTAASARTLAGLSEGSISLSEVMSRSNMHVDEVTGDLYVPDIYNNRVLRFPFDADEADAVWGQPDFFANERRSATDGLSFQYAVDRSIGGGCCLDSGGRLWVADSGNHRVVRFNGSTIDHEISGLAGPVDVAVGPNDALYIAEAGNFISCYLPPYADADRTVFATPTYPLGIKATSDGLWVTQTNDLKLVFYGYNGAIKREISGLYVQGISSAVAVDTGGNVFAVRAGNDHDLYRWDNPLHRPADELTGAPDRRYWTPPFGPNQISGDRLGVGGCFMTVAGDQLFVADGTRLLVWDGLDGLQTGDHADHVWVTGKKPSYTEVGHWAISALAADETQLAVAYGAGGAAKIRMYSLPFDGTVIEDRDTEWSPAVYGLAWWGGTLMISSRDDRAVSGLLYDDWGAPGALAVDPSGNLWVCNSALEAAGKRELLAFDPSGNLIHTIPQPTFQPAFDSQGRMAAGYNRYLLDEPRVGLYTDPLHQTAPDSYLPHVYSMAVSCAFDDQDRLYVVDLNRSLVRRYDNPFGDTVEEPEEDPPEQTTVTLTFMDRTWYSFVAPISGATNVAVRKQRKGWTQTVVQGELYDIRGPAILTITA